MLPPRIVLLPETPHCIALAMLDLLKILSCDNPPKDSNMAEAAGAGAAGAAPEQQIAEDNPKPWEETR